VTPTAPAPLDREALAAALRPFGSSRALPGAAYTSSEVLDWERRHLFAGGWTCVGRTGELFAGITHRAMVVGDIGVLLTFDGTHRKPRAFANVCRHRAHELLPDGGAADRRAVVCPYHGWAYRLDGTHLGSRPGDLDEHLVALPAVDWDGWLMVNATGDGEPFDEYLGALRELLNPYTMNELRLGARHRYEVAANWKILVENYHECYHCPQIHPELCKVSPPTSGDNWDLPGRWVGGSMTLRPHAETMSLSGQGSGVRILDAPQGTVRYVSLLPNLLLSAHPDYVMAHRLTPLAPGRTDVECSWYFPAADVDPAYAVDFWDLTNRQDWAACESVQRGVSSPHFRPGPLAAGEDAVYQWMALIARAYLG
jgi:Rieske 2Fe-2S family protein